MKHKILWLSISCTLLAAALAFFQLVEYLYSPPMPKPSALGGYYDEAFTLKLSVPFGGSIYYTTDGSTPTMESQHYENGILIYGRSQEPNIYNSIRNVKMEWQNYIPDETPVEKGTVVRAIAVNAIGNQSEVFTQTYFVGVEPLEEGYSLSLIFEYEDLFGDDGLYVTGKEYDDWYLSEGAAEDEPRPNFKLHTEAEAIAEWMNSSGDVLIQPIGLRLQGASTRTMNAKKRFNLFAREEYSGSKVFQKELYDGVTTHSAMLKSALSDAMSADLIADRAVAAQRSIPVRVYLNGEYWYDTYMLERYDKEYFRQYYKVDDRVLIKNGVIDEDSAAAYGTEAYGDFIWLVENTDFSDSRAWEELLLTADIQSYIDFIVTNYYLCNVDFGDFQNCVLWRSPEVKESQYEDMRWRWCVYDIDSIGWAANGRDVENAAEINNFSVDFPFAVTINKQVLFSSFRKSPEFNRQFVLSFMDMVNNNFAPANVEKVLAKYGETLDWMDGFFRLRPQYAPQHLAEEFGLTGALETVTVTTADPNMGSVKVNTSVIDLSDGSWSGRYFTDYPITLTAEAAEGYRFVGWKVGGDITDISIVISASGEPHVTAVFQKKDSGS